MSNYFFGRETQLSLLRRNFFVTSPGTGFCGSVKGPNDIGKTMLIREAAKEFESKPHPNVYYFATGIIASGSYWQFWVELIRRFAKQITEEKLYAAPNPDPDFIELITDAYAFFGDDQNMDRMGTGSFHSDAIEHLNFLFTAYTELGIHILITIDEFDNARAAFPVDGGDGSFFQRLYMLSPKSMNEYRVSILLISRRRIGTIAHHMADGSDIESAFPPFIVLRGFTNAELDEYFASYQDIEGLTLEEQDRRDVIYFCGRHPGQLMKMRTLYERYYVEGEDITPASLYFEYGEEMQTLYERMNKLLRTEFVDAEMQCNCVGTFAQVFIGPTYDTNIKSRLDQLFKYGLISKWDNAKSGENIFQLAGLPCDADAEHRFEYEPMSPYYIEFFKSRVLPEERDTIGRMMETAEMDVRAGILAVLKTMFPDTWEEKLEGFTNAGKQHFRAQLDAIAYQNDTYTRNVTYTNLDVMSYLDYANIIVAYWEPMKAYFSSFRTPDELREKFQFLYDCRNCYAHNNLRILDEQSCARLKDYCSDVIRDYEQGEKGEKAETVAPVMETVVAPAAGGSAGAGAVGSTVAEEPVVIPSEEQIKELLEAGEKVVFVYKEKKMPKGNLRGCIKGYGYPAGISKPMIAGFGFTVPPRPGAEFEAQVMRWDQNAGMFNLIAP